MSDVNGFEPTMSNGERITDWQCPPKIFCPPLDNKGGNDCWANVSFQLRLLLEFFSPAQADLLKERVDEDYEKANGHQRDAISDILNPLFADSPNYCIKFVGSDVEFSSDDTHLHQFVEWQDYATRAAGEHYTLSKTHQDFVPIFHIIHKGGDGTGGHWFALRLIEKTWYRLDDLHEKRVCPVDEPVSGTVIFSLFVRKNTVGFDCDTCVEFIEEKFGDSSGQSVQSDEVQSEATGESWKEFSGRQTGFEDYQFGDLTRGLTRGLFDDFTRGLLDSLPR